MSAETQGRTDRIISTWLKTMPRDKVGLFFGVEEVFLQHKEGLLEIWNGMCIRNRLRNFTTGG